MRNARRLLVLAVCLPVVAATALVPSVAESGRHVAAPGTAGTPAGPSCPAAPTALYSTSAGSFEAAFPAKPTVSMGDATSVQNSNGDIASFWQTFATAGRYTRGPVVTAQHAPAGQGYCDAGVAVARVRPGDQARLAKLLSAELNFRFSDIDGADVGAGLAAEGPSTGYDALGLTPTELVAAVAVEPTSARSEQFVASVSATGLAMGALAAATPGAAEEGGTLMGTAAICMGVIPQKYSETVM